LCSFDAWDYGVELEYLQLEGLSGKRGSKFTCRTAITTHADADTFLRARVRVNARAVIDQRGVGHREGILLAFETAPQFVF